MSTNPFETEAKWNSNTYDKPMEYRFSPVLDVQHSRAIASQQRALKSMAHSEKVGVDTLNDLAEQGEKLKRTEEKLSQISELQKDGQRQINSLSSLFGGFKNMFSKKPVEPSQPNKASLSQTQTASQQSNVQPVKKAPFVIPESTCQLNEVDEKNVDFDKNLTQMSAGMLRLKSLATAMNGELQTQNQQLDKLSPHMDRINDTVTHQNKQMNKLLGIKPQR